MADETTAAATKSTWRERERATRRTRVAIIARFITRVRFVCSAEKKPERERERRAFLRGLEEKRFVCPLLFLPFLRLPLFSPILFFHSSAFSFSSNRRIDAIPRSSGGIVNDSCRRRDSPHVVDQRIVQCMGGRERERLGKVFVSSSFYDGRYSLRETLEV